MALAHFLVFLGLGCSDSTIKTFSEPPTVTIVTPPADAHVDQAVDVVLTGLVTDSEFSSSLSTLSAQWSVDGDAICSGAVVDDGGNIECVHAFSSTGEQVLRLTVTNPDGATAVAESTVVVDPNNAPLATILLPEVGATLYSDQLTEFAGLVSDTEDPADTLVAYWVSSLDGELDLDSTPTSAGELSGATILSEGEHLITLTVEDQTGLTGEDTLLLVVGPANSPPDCEITAPENNQSFEIGSTVLFEGTATDNDIASSALDVEWKSNVDGVLSTTAPTSAGNMSFGASALSQGTHTITLTVWDELGADCSDAILVTLGSGPSITITDPTTGDVYNEGTSVAFSANVTDADDSPTALDITWSSSLDGDLSTASANSSGITSFSDRNLSVGEHTITVTATDPDGYYGNDSIRLTINGLPDAPVVQISPDPATSADDLVATITTESTDPDGDAISYLYEWYRNGTLSTYTTDTIPALATARGDTWRVEVAATDGLGESTVGTDSISIANSPPSLADVSITPSSPVEGDTLTCVPGTATDPDGDSISYSYSWSVSGTSPGVTTSTLGSSRFSRGDSVTCTVTPTDGTTAGDPVTSDAVEIGNSAPSVSSVNLSPRTAYEATTLTCTPATGTDVDGDTVSFTYDWIVDGVRLGVGSSTLTGTYFDKEEDVVCEATPTDGSDSGTPVESNTVTILNTPPEVASASLSPTTATESTTFTCTAGTRSDDDGDSVTVTYGWLIDGAEIATTGATLTGSSFSKGNSVACFVTPNDGDDDGDAVVSSAVTVSNTAPVLASVSISPTSPTESDTLTCTPGTVTDADGDSVSYTYAWTVSGASAGVTTATLTGSSFDKGDTVTCTVTPFDGTSTGTARTSSAVTIVNSAPVLGTVNLSPTTAYEATTLTCTPGTTTDADGDGITYTYDWTVAGSALGLDSSTLTGSWFNKGEAITCQATPYDGTVSGSAVTSNTVTILNTAPVVASASLSPTTATESSTLTCSSGATSDADGDTVTVSYSWEIDGATISATGSTLTSANFAKGDSVTCLATPNDGTTNGTAAESSAVVIGNSAPVLTSVSLSPTTPYTDDDVVASVGTVSDLDGDSISYTYAWYVAGSLVSGATGATLDSAWHEKHDTIYVRVTPYDGTDYGAAVSSSTIEVENTPPTAPVVSIEPGTAEPDDSLTCVIDTASTDNDLDTITYTYAWYLDGSLYSGLTSDTVSYSYTEHGDTWQCIVTPFDGEDTGTSASDSVSVTDRSAPDQPLISAIEALRNDTDVELEGSAEAGSTVTVYMDCDDGTLDSESTTADSSGLWDLEMTIPTGAECDFYAIAVDAVGNVSDESNTVTTESCDPVDDYEDSTGLGDSCSAAVDDWLVIPDDGTTVTVTGNVIDSTDVDWYVFETSQSVLSAGTNVYNFEAVLTYGSTHYQFAVYRDGCASSALECSGEATAWDQYSYYGFDAGESVHSAPSDTRYCDDSSWYNDCDDLSATYYIKVWRTTSATSCAYYELEVSNGVW